MKVLLTDNIDSRAAEKLRQRGFEVDEVPTLPAEALRARIGQYDAVAVRSATRLGRDVLAEAKRLKLIVRGGVGIDNIDVEAAAGQGITVANTPDANTLATAELTFALMLALARNLVAAHQSLVAGEWKRNQFRGVELAGKTLGLVGLGRIGTAVARRARAFDMQVLAYDPYVDAERFASEGVQRVTLDELYRESDFLSLHVPLTPETHKMIDAAAIEKMKPGIRLINASRGGLLDDNAVAQALDQGRIAGVALDVYEVEPPPQDHPLIGRPNVISVPHLGALTQEAQLRVADEVARVIIEFFEHSQGSSVKTVG